MNNGQVSVVSAQAVTQLVTQDSSVTVAVTTNGTKKQDGDFAGLLSGIQLMAKSNGSSDSGRTEQSLNKDGKPLDVSEVSIEEPTADLLTRIQVLPPVLGLSLPKHIESKTDGTSSDAVPLRSESADVASQMAMAAYVQTGRMPDVNISTQLPVDVLQDVASVPEQPAVISASAVKMPSERTVTEQLQAPQVVMPVQLGAAKEQAPAYSPQPVASDRMTVVDNSTSLSAYSVASAAEPSAVISTPAATIQSEQVVTEPLQAPQAVMPVPPGSAKESAPASAPQPVASERKPEVNNLTSFSAVRAQNVEPVPDKPAVISASSIKMPLEQVQVVAEQPVQVPQTIMPVQLEPASKCAPASSQQPAAPERMFEVNTQTPLPVDRLQNVAVAPEQPVVIAAPLVVVPKQSEQLPIVPMKAAEQTVKSSVALVETPVAEPAAEKSQYHQPEAVQTTDNGRQPVTAVAELLVQNQHSQPETVRTVNVDKQPVTAEMPVPAATTVQQAANVKTAEVNKPIPLPVDPLQTVTATTEQAAVIADPVVTTKAEKAVVELIQPAATKLSQAEQPADRNQAAPAPVVTQESELDIQLSQPRPITARVTAAALTENRSAALGRQPLASEPRIDKVRISNEKNDVKEMTSPLPFAAPADESPVGSGTSGGSESNQSGSSSDNQMLAQNMRGQLSIDQKISANTPKLIQAEPLRQDVADQVGQQLKERLVHHEVKAGSQQITLTLSPDSLGEVKMNLNLQGQKLSVEIVTENRTVRDAIIQHTDALKESLARQNITMESFDVTTGGKGSGGQGQNQNAWRELAKQQQQQQLWASPRGYHIAQADIPSGSAAYQKQQGQSMLDIHY